MAVVTELRPGDEVSRTHSGSVFVDRIRSFSRRPQKELRTNLLLPLPRRRNPSSGYVKSKNARRKEDTVFFSRSSCLRGHPPQWTDDATNSALHRQRDRSRRPRNVFLRDFAAGNAHLHFPWTLQMVTAHESTVHLVEKGTVHRKSDAFGEHEDAKITWCVESFSCLRSSTCFPHLIHLFLVVLKIHRGKLWSVRRHGLIARPYLTC